MTAQTFFKITVWYLILFVLYNALVWQMFTKDFRDPVRHGIGDLARLGYLPWIRSVQAPPSLPRHHLELEEYHGQRIDLLTLGDSFSNGGGGAYYQDYIESLNNLTVLNIEPFVVGDYITQLSWYLSSGFLDRVKPRYVLLSSHENYIAERFSPPVDYTRSVTPEELAVKKKFSYRPALNPRLEAKPARHDVMEFINEGNFKLLLYQVLFQFSDHAVFSKTCRSLLSTPLFSGNYGSTLLFYRDDLQNMAYNTPDVVARVNDNLNQLADRLAAKGITLVFMPVVGKYNLYQPYIVNNRYPESKFFEVLRTLPRRYLLIDTKSLLSEELKSGQKDLFSLNDSHWTWRAPKKIFETVRFP